MTQPGSPRPAPGLPAVPDATGEDNDRTLFLEAPDATLPPQRPGAGTPAAGPAAGGTASAAGFATGAGDAGPPSARPAALRTPAPGTPVAGAFDTAEAQTGEADTALPPVGPAAVRSLAAGAPATEDDIPTLRMPAPGGQATVLRPRPAPATPPASRSADVALQRLVAGVNPLLGAAGVLLGLVAQLRATSAHADPPGLRRRLLEHMADFEHQAAAAGVARPRITAARYLLCTFLDEVIAATPWGAGTWERQPLLQAFHEEAWGGDKAFELLEKLGQDPAANAEVLELFYVCLALGFEGRWRGQPDAAARLDALAARVLSVVRPAAQVPAAAPLALSPRWEGVVAPQRPGLRLPAWSLCLLAGTALLALVLFWQLRLDVRAQPLLRQLHALPAALQPERAAAPAPAARLAPALQADAAAGALTVRDERLRSVLTLPADALFKGGGAELQAGAPALLGRIAQALRGQPGQVQVIGHGDDTAPASLQFPSSWHLSRARAQAVLDELARRGVPAQRLHAEGRGDAEPLSQGRTAADRARNRRVEIELRLPRPEG